MCYFLEIITLLMLLMSVYKARFTEGSGFAIVNTRPNSTISSAYAVS